MPWAYLKMATFPSPARNTREFFSDLCCDNLIGLLEVQLTKMAGSPLRLNPFGVFLSQTCSHWASSNLSFTGYTFTHTLGPFPKEVLATGLLILCICLFVSDLGSSSLPYDLSSLRDRRRVVDFQFVLLFSCCVEKATSKLFTGCIKHWKSLVHIFIVMFVYSYPLECKFYKGRDFCLICSLQYCQCLEQCLIHSKHSDNISLKKLNKWKKHLPVVSSTEIS